MSDSEPAYLDTSALLDKVDLIAEKRDRKEPNFWNGIIKPEYQLVRGLTEDALDARQDGIIKGYLAMRQRGASAREFRSVTEQLDFLIVMTPYGLNRIG